MVVFVVFQCIQYKHTCVCHVRIHWLNLYSVYSAVRALCASNNNECKVFRIVFLCPRSRLILIMMNILCNNYKLLQNCQIDQHSQVHAHTLDCMHTHTHTTTTTTLQCVCVPMCLHISRYVGNRKNTAGKKFWWLTWVKIVLSYNHM